jgi:hypothetical protein
MHNESIERQRRDANLLDLSSPVEEVDLIDLTSFADEENEENKTAQTLLSLRHAT